MRYEELIKSCIDILESYNANKEGADSYAEKFLKTKTKDSNERMFIKQIFYGVLRYNDFLKVFSNKLFELNKFSTERKDETLYHIFCYITVFRLEELPAEDYKSLIMSQDAVKMNEFFKFIFNFEIIQEVLRPEWIKQYDFMYVDSKLIEGLRNNYEMFNDLISFIYKKASAGLSMSNSTKDASISHEVVTKKITIPEPFNLSKPKTRKILEPLPIQNKVEVRPIPLADFQKTNLEKIEVENKKRKEEIKKTVEKKYEGIKIEFETDKRPMYKEKIKEEIEKLREEELDFGRKKKEHKIVPPKDFSNIPAEIKYNEAAIIREEYLINKKKKLEEDEINKIIIEKKDSTEYQRWRREMEEKDKITRLEEINKRKIELELAREEALDAFNKKLIKNKKLVLEHKREEMIRANEKKEELEKEIEMKRKLVEEMKKEEKENLKSEKEKLINLNKENYAKHQEEMKDLILKQKEEKKYEEEKRMELIIQIRELEKLPVVRTKGFDPTETGGLGLLDEMSMVELRERLENQKIYFKNYIDAKKEENKIKNEDKVDELVEKAKIISMERDRLRNQKEIERKNKKLNKIQEKKVVTEIREKCLFQLKQKIELKKSKKKKEEDEFEKLIREIKLQRQYLQQGRAVVEEKAYKQIEDGLERKMNDNQNIELIDQERKETVKYGEIRIRYRSAKVEVQSNRKLFEDYDNKYNNLKKINENINIDDDNYKKLMYEKERQIEAVSKVKYQNKNKYSERLSENTKSGTGSATKKLKPLTSHGNRSTTTKKQIKLKELDSSGSASVEKNPIYEKIEKEKFII